MRKLVYFVAVSVDGYIAGPKGEFDFFPLEGDHISTQLEELPETLPLHVRRALGVETRRARFDTVVMGRGTYEPAMSAGIVDPYEPLETVVFSRTLPAKISGRVRVTADDPVGVVRALKAAEGADIWLCGGGSLAGQLRDEIDELTVKINPVIAGGGVRVFATQYRPSKLVLRGRRGFDSGVTWLTYARP